MPGELCNSLSGCEERGARCHGEGGMDRGGCVLTSAPVRLRCQEGFGSSGNADGCSGLAGAVLVLRVSGAVDKTLQWCVREVCRQQMGWRSCLQKSISNFCFDHCLYHSFLCAGVRGSKQHWVSA